MIKEHAMGIFGIYSYCNVECTSCDLWGINSIKSVVGAREWTAILQGIFYALIDASYRNEICKYNCRTKKYRAKRRVHHESNALILAFVEGTFMYTV